MTDTSPRASVATAPRPAPQEPTTKPWAAGLPCPICSGIEGCDHSVPERAAATNHWYARAMNAERLVRQIGAVAPTTLALARSQVLAQRETLPVPSLER